MADDYVPASPISLKAKKRKGALLHRRSKKQRKNNEQSAEHLPFTTEIEANVSNPQAINLNNEACNNAIVENVDCKKDLDITALYWSEADVNPSQRLQNVDLFYEARILEDANQPLQKGASKIPLYLVQEKFLTLDVLSQRLEPKTPLPKEKYETQFPAESEFVRLCEVVDAVSDLHHNVPRFSQWNSPVEGHASSTPVRKPDSVSENKEPSACENSSETITETPKVIPKSSPKPGTSYARLKYGHEIDKAARKRINFFDDSDSKSSLSSELSMQSDQGVQFTPLDEVDLDKSFHIQENLRNLSSFFSQSFVEDDVDATTNGVFRYIMLLKSKRKDTRMIHWFRSGGNFQVNDTRSSKSWEGFPSGEKVASTAIESSDNGVHELLGEDDDIFAELPEEKLAGECSSAADWDVDSILKNADRVLQDVTEYEARQEEEALNRNPRSERQEPLNNAVHGVNIETLLHGHILATPKMSEPSESTLPETSPWIMRPKIQNSITASDIEWDSELKFRDTAANNEFPSALNTTFIVSKSPNNSKRSESNNTFSENRVLKQHKKQSDAPSSVPMHTSNNLQDTPALNGRKYSMFFEKTPIIPKYQKPVEKTALISEEALKCAGQFLAEDIKSPKNTKSDGTRRKAMRNCLKENLMSPGVQNPWHSTFSGKNPKQLIAGKETPGSSSASGSKLLISVAAEHKAQQFAAEMESELDKHSVEQLRDHAKDNTASSYQLNQLRFCDPGLCKPGLGNIRNGYLTSEKRKRALFRDDDGTDNIENMSSVANSGWERSSVYEETKTPSILMNKFQSNPCTEASSSLPAEDHSKFNPSLMRGFRTALGKKIPISDEAKAKAIKIVQEEMGSIEFPVVFEDSLKNEAASPLLKENFEDPDKLQDNLAVPENETLFVGFKTASGASIEISDEARLKAEKIMAEVEGTSVETKLVSFKAPKLSTNTTPTIRGFQCASGKAERVLAEMDDGLISENPVIELPTFKSPGKHTSEVRFKSASGKTISISADALAKAKKMMIEEDDELLANINLSPVSCAVPRTTESAPDASITGVNDSAKHQIDPESKCLTKRGLGLNFMKGRMNRVGANASNPRCLSPLAITTNPNSVHGSAKASPSYRPPGRIQSPLAASFDKDALTPQRNMCGVVLSKSRLSLRNKRFKPPDVVLNTSETPNRANLLHSQIATPNFKELFDSVETSTPKNQAKTRARQGMFTLSQEISASKDALLADEAQVDDNQKSIRKINWDSEVEKVDAIDTNNDVMKVSTEILQQRAKKREEQQGIIRGKNRFEGFVKPGDHFIKKMQTNRVKLKQLLNCQGKPHFHSVEFSNMLAFKFNSSSEVTAIPTEDDAYIVPNDESKIGFDEIKNGFLILPSVSPVLIPPNWIQHHYKMILHKLHWLETISSGFLTPRNVCLQLKYRYDHELDRAHRSALRKILECDDSPAKRMVLSVLAIHNTDFGAELELTDRWYSVRACIDLAMQDLIDSGKVRVGTKLMIQSAELLNCKEGCDPLEVPENVRFKISTNSTRRARWDTKLGFYKVQAPFLLSLDQIRVNGKMVTRLEVYILRVYPSLYLKVGTDVSGFHSEKVEQQLRNMGEVSKLSTIEAIFSQVQKEVDSEDKKASKNSLSIKKNIKEISNPAELYDLLKWEDNSIEIESELSCVQRTLLSDYQQQVHAERMKEIQRRVVAKLENQASGRPSKELLKIRVIDRRKPNKTAILSIWAPHEDLKTLLQERKAVEITNLISKGCQSSEMQLTSTKSSQFKLVHATNIKNGNHCQRTAYSIPENYHRQVTRIEETYSSTFKPAFNELDTYGLIVMIGDDDGTHQPKRFQPVYLADSAGNILCLNFWIGIKEYGYEDVIRIHRFVAANNLQWRSNSGCGPIRIAFVTSTTTFTEKPRNQDILHALDTMKAHFRSNHGEHTQQFIEKCQKKIKEIKSRPKSSSYLSVSSSTSLNASNNFNNTSDSSMNGHASSSMNASTSLNNSSGIVGRISVQERMEKLKVYGNPPELSPMIIRRTKAVRRAFKVPAKVTEDHVC